MFSYKKSVKNINRNSFLANELGWVKTLFKSITYISVRLYKTGFYLIKLHQPPPSILSSRSRSTLKSLLFNVFLRKKGSGFQEEVQT
jgi:hypothetical protein